MRALDLAREKVPPPTPEHEAYRVRRSVPPSGATCCLCDQPVTFGLEIIFRLRGSCSRDRRFGYVHVPCLRPIPTFFEEEPHAPGR